MSSDEAVAHGIKTTAGTVTERRGRSWSPCSPPSRRGSTLDTKEMGVGLAFAMLIDATVIRGVLLPASMKLLGRPQLVPAALAAVAAASSTSRATAPARAASARPRQGHGALPEPAAA